MTNAQLTQQGGNPHSFAQHMHLYVMKIGLLEICILYKLGWSYLANLNMATLGMRNREWSALLGSQPEIQRKFDSDSKMLAFKLGEAYLPRTIPSFPKFNNATIFDPPAI